LGGVLALGRIIREWTNHACSWASPLFMLPSFLVFSRTWSFTFSGSRFRCWPDSYWAASVLLSFPSSSSPSSSCRHPLPRVALRLGMVSLVEDRSFDNLPLIPPFVFVPPMTAHSWEDMRRPVTSPDKLYPPVSFHFFRKQWNQVF